MSILSAPEIRTPMSLWEATLSVHWIGKVSVLDWFCVEKQNKVDDKDETKTRNCGQLIVFCLYYQAGEAGEILR